MNTAYLSLGSNLGNKPKFLNDAITQLGIHSDITMDRVSAFYKTEPVGVVDQDWFLNAVVKIETTLCPEALLARCQSIEAQFQRQRTRQWGPRTLDIDILLYSDLSMARKELTIPHPRMLERAFVLIPLQAIAPHMILAGKPITAYTQAVCDQEIEVFSASSVHSPSLTSRGGSSQKPSSATPCTEILDTAWQGANLVTCFQGFPYRSLLDSSMQYTDHGQYTIFCYDPYLVFKSKGKQCTVWRDNISIDSYQDSPLQYFESLLAPYQISNTTSLPFIGGAIGYCSYDLCHEFEALPRNAIDDRELPDMHYCFYDGAIVVDHIAQQTHVVGAGVVQDGPKYVRDTLRQLSIYSSQIPELPLNVQGNPTLWRSNMTKYAYVDKVCKIKRYIASGDIYQVNLAHRFTTETHLSPESVYAQLSQVNPAPYAAFIESDAGTLLSSSPECFLRIQDNAILTRPIKGTRARSPNVHVDAAQKNELFNCEKERAELLMIVDLERNDLGRICQPGSVQVKDLYHIESYATVHHMVGDVRGSLRPNTSLEQILRATFPGGSITGAPKLRAMEIIDELEPHQRNVYTGAIGLIGYDRAIHLNIAIRTLLMQDQHVYFQVGAGIVWDSDPIKEYEETLHKAKAIFEVFGADTHQTEEA